MSNIGSLVVSLEANIAKFQSDMGKAASEAEKRALEIDKSFGLVKKGLASIGIGFALGATFDSIKSKIEGVIKSAAGLQQMSEKTGSAVEALSGLVGVAKLSGTSADDLTSGLQKLAKAMIDAENGGTKTTAAFKAIGISTDQLKGKSPADMFLLISNQLAKYKDGAEKLVIAQILLGKAGANLLPVSKDLAIVGEYLVKTTGEQAEEADRLEKNQIRLAASTDAIFKKIGLELIPVFDAFTKALLDTQAANGGVRGEVDRLAKDGSIRAWAEDAIMVVGYVIDAFDGVVRVVQIVGKSIGSIAAQVAANIRGDFSQAASIAKSTGEDIDGILNKTLFSTRLSKQLENNRLPVSVTKPLPTPDVSGVGNKNGPKGPADDPAKKLLEGQLKNLEAFIAAEKTQLATREQYLSYYYNAEYLKAGEYYDKKRELIQVTLKAELEAYDKEAAAITIYLAQAQKEVDKQDARNKLGEVSKKRMAAELDANKRLTDAILEQAKAYRDFELATRDVAHQSDLMNAQARFQIDLMGKSTLAVLQATEARRIDLALEQRIYDIRKKFGDDDLKVNELIAQATTQAEAQKQAAIKLTTEAYEKQRDGFYGASEAVRKYVEEATNNGAQIENILTNAFKGAEDALVNFVTTGKLDFKSLANSIISDLARMAIKQQIIAPLAQSLGLDAGGKSSGGAGGSASGLGGLFSSVIGAFSGGGGTSDVLGDFIKTKGYADGGSPPLNVPSLVGERGPELFMPTSAGTIIPNSALKGSGSGDSSPMVVNNHFSFSEAPSRKTQDQVALAAGNAVNRARRNA